MKTENDAYQAGIDCAINGANTTNCHFTFFATKELSDAHSRGVKQGCKNRTEDKYYFQSI
jgi:hypothetical protein